MKILLISENRTTTLLSPFPLGLAFVSSSLRRAGHEISVLDFMFLDSWQERLHDTLKNFQPDVVGLSIRNLDNQDMGNPVFFLGDLPEIVRAIREQSNAPVVLGGAGFNIHPAGCLNFLKADFGIFGEGEEAFALLLDAMLGGRLGQVPGLVWKEDERITVNPPRYLYGPEQWVSPAYEEFDLAAYHEAGTDMPGGITVQARRGCHMKCIYCSTPSLEGTRCRSRDLRRVADEIAALREKGLRRFYMVDNVFNFPLSQAKEFCRDIISHGLDISWQAILSPAFGDEELFELMAKAGCSFVSLGNESGHQLMLRNLRKGFTLNNVRKTARLARANGIRFGSFLLLGGPGETRETVEQSMEFVDELSPDLVSLKAGIRIYPGTELETIAREEGMIGKEQDLLHPVFYLSPAIGEWIRDYLEEIAAKRKNWKI